MTLLREWDIRSIQDTGNRWQQKVNGEMKDFYELVRSL